MDGDDSELLVGGAHDGFMGDTRVLSFYLAPFVWNPETGRLTFCIEIEVTVALEPSFPSRPVRRMTSGSDRFEAAVRKSVANPEDVARFRASARRRSLVGASMLEDGPFEYVVVTVDSMASAFGRACS